MNGKINETIFASLMHRAKPALGRLIGRIRNRIVQNTGVCFVCTEVLERSEHVLTTPKAVAARASCKTQ